MFVIGTSGHIDHGKTSLIKALTGIDCDRLPEEKEREMTIDIGFASLTFPKLGMVSIIDVPGHERFIRNMVVGAWGIDLALLVVAVDDGWMPQTEDHFRVLTLLGVERVIGVLTKIDLTDEDMIELARQEVSEKLDAGGFPEADIVAVSSRTGAGIDELRRVILENLRKLPAAGDAQRPYLFIDRVFAPHGFGTVVTGTLKNGVFEENETVTVLPQKQEAKIKKIESHFQEQQEGSPSQRTALNLSGVYVHELERGHIVCRHDFFTETQEIVARLTVLPQKKIKNNAGIEVLVGTAALKGKIILLDEEADTGGLFPARIKFERPWFFYPGEPFVLTNPGGFRVLGGGTVLLPRYRKELRDALMRGLETMDDFSRRGIFAFTIRVLGCLELETLVNGFPDSGKSLEKMAQGLVKEGVAVVRGPFIMTAAYFRAGCDAMYHAIQEGPGSNAREIADRTGLPEEVCRSLIADVQKEHTVIEKDGKFFGGEAISEDTLSDERRKVLAQFLAYGGEGLELERATDERLKREVRELIKLGFLVSLDGNIIYHRDVYARMKERVLALFEGRDKISVPEAKDATGLSRKYILPLLNRVEREGLLKRIGDFRIKG